MHFREDRSQQLQAASFFQNLLSVFDFFLPFSPFPPTPMLYKDCYLLKFVIFLSDITQYWQKSQYCIFRLELRNMLLSCDYFSGI